MGIRGKQFDFDNDNTTNIESFNLHSSLAKFVKVKTIDRDISKHSEGSFFTTTTTTLPLNPKTGQITWHILKPLFLGITVSNKSWSTSILLKPLCNHMQYLSKYA